MIIPPEIYDVRKEKAGEYFRVFTKPRYEHLEKFANLGGEIFYANSDLADEAANLYKDLKYWNAELEANIQIYTEKEILYRLDYLDEKFYDILDKYAHSIKKVEKNEIKEILKYSEIAPYQLEFILACQNSSRAWEYLIWLPDVDLMWIVSN